MTHRMGAADFEEVSSGLGMADPEEIALHSFNAAGWSWCFARETPVAILGIEPMGAGIYIAWMFSTDELPRVIRPLTKWVRQVLRPALIATGGTALLAYSHVNHSAAHRWLESLGAERRAELPGWARNGSDFCLFAWSNPNVPIQSQVPAAPERP